MICISFYGWFGLVWLMYALNCFYIGYAYIILVKYSKYQWRKLAWITLWEELFVNFNETLQKEEKEKKTENILYQLTI